MSEPTSAAAEPASPVVEPATPVPEPVERQPDEGASAAEPTPRGPSWRLAIGLCATSLALALVLGAAAHAWLAAPPAAAAVAAAPATPMTDGAAHAHSGGQLDTMVAKLSARLAAGVGGAEDWAMLARSQAMRGDHAAAVQAFGKAIAGMPQDARLLVDYADALAMTQGARIDGEPLELIDAALKIDPDNIKGLALAGTAAFDRGDYRVAVARWEHATRVAAPDDPIAQGLAGGLADARRLAGSSAASAPSAVAGLREAIKSWP